MDGTNQVTWTLQMCLWRSIILLSYTCHLVWLTAYLQICYDIQWWEWEAMGLLHFSSQHFSFQNVFIRYQTTCFLLHNCNASVTITGRAKFWPPCLKEATNLSPFLVFPHMFFIFYLLVDLLPGKQRHNSLLSKKSTAEVSWSFHSASHCLYF